MSKVADPLRTTGGALPWKSIGAPMTQMLPALIRDAGQLDRAAVAHLEAALAAWDKSYSYYIKS